MLYWPSGDNEMQLRSKKAAINVIIWLNYLSIDIRVHYLHQATISFWEPSGWMYRKSEKNIINIEKPFCFQEIDFDCLLAKRHAHCDAISPETPTNKYSTIIKQIVHFFKLKIQLFYCIHIPRWMPSMLDKTNKRSESDFMLWHHQPTTFISAANRCAQSLTLIYHTPLRHRPAFYSLPMTSPTVPVCAIDHRMSLDPAVSIILCALEPVGNPEHMSLDAFSSAQSCVSLPSSENSSPPVHNRCPVMVPQIPDVPIRVNEKHSGSLESPKYLPPSFSLKDQSNSSIFTTASRSLGGRSSPFALRKQFVNTITRASPRRGFLICRLCDEEIWGPNGKSEARYMVHVWNQRFVIEPFSNRLWNIALHYR